MTDHTIRKGLDLPIAGQPVREIQRAQNIRHVGLLGHDYPGMRPRMHVAVGDKVRRGQKVFSDRKTEGVDFCAPAAGEVVAINRGDQRAFRSLVIRLSDAELEASGDSSQVEQVEFQSKVDGAKNLSVDDVRGLLVESGLWSALRTRPFDRVPSPQTQTTAVFVTAVDTNPLAPDPTFVVEEQQEAFLEGLRAIRKLTEGQVFVCVGPDWKLEFEDLPTVEKHVFRGPHPAGLVGTHIHMLCPVHRGRTVWHIGYQDVLEIGHLLLTGRLRPERVATLAGPSVVAPRYVQTRVGSSIKELADGELDDALETRLVSGSVLFGHSAQDEAVSFLNRYDTQVTALAEERARELLGWLGPGFNKFSTIGAFLSKWLPAKEFNFTTTTNGSHRAMVPIGMYERVMPLDIMPTFLLRSLLMGDLERAEQLGALELHEEDLALCSFVSPGKEDYGVALRNVLTEIWREG